MRSEAPALLPIFRSRHQAELLAALFLHPGVERTVTELAAEVGVPLTTAHREVARLVEAGLLESRQVGRSRLVRAAVGHRAAGPLTELLALSFGPPSVLAEEFTGVPGVVWVVVFGSWAARYAGVTGPPPADVDVLVVGEVSRREVYAAAERAQARLGMPVNPVLRTVAQWQAADVDADALVAQVRAGEYLVVLEAPAAAPADHGEVTTGGAGGPGGGVRSARRDTGGASEVGQGQ